MALSTTQYGYIIDPFVPFTAPDGRTIRNGYVKVFLAGSSTPVITYANFDGTANQERIQLDNSGRTAYPVIVSKGNTYKVCVYDAEHSQDSPILTIDKVVPAGANVEATNIVTGLDNVESPEAGWVKSTVSGTDAEVSLDATNVTSEVDTMVKATAASADYMMPLVHKTGSDPDKKITLGNIFKFVLNFIHSLTDTATESDIVSGNYFALDGSAGTKKLNSTTLLTKTAQNALAGNVAQAFDPTRDEDHPYFAGESVVYDGVTYTFVVDHYGAWDDGKVVDGLNFQENKGLKKKTASSAGFSIWGTAFSVSSRTWGLNKRIKGYVKRVSSILKANSSIDVLAIAAGSLKKVKIGTLVNSGATIKYVSVDVNAFIDGYIGLHESSGTSVVPYVTRNDGECNSFVIADSTPTTFEANANWAPVLDVEYNDAEEYGAEGKVVENIVSGTASVNLGLPQAFTNRAVCLPNPIKGLVKKLSVYVVAGKSLFVCVCNGKSVKPYIYASNSEASNKWMNFDCHIVMNEGDYIGILGADGYAAYAKRNDVNGGAKFFVSDGTTSESSVWTIGLSVTVESDVNEIISNLPKNIVVPFYGQSLSVGADASPELKSADLKNAVSLNGKVVVSSVSASDIVKYEFTKLNEDIIETPATGCALGVIETLSERFGIPKNSDVWKDVNFYFVSCGQGSTSLEALADSEGTLYQGLINAVSHIVDLIEADGKEAFIPALVWIQGETNMRYGVESPSYYADSYASKLSALVSSLNTAFKSMTGQTADIKCICYQTASQGYINGQYFHLDWNFTNIPKLSKVPMQQMLAVRDYDNFVASVPVYAITHNEDVTGKANIHLTNDGSRHLGYYCGRALASVLLGDGVKCGILPISYKVSGNDIFVKFSIEEGTLTTDTSFVRKVENFGFSVLTSGNVELISSIEIYSDEVVVHCSASPIGALLSYACVGEDGYDGRTRGARGNLCSTSEKFVQIVNKKVVQKDFCFAFYCVLADGLNDVEYLKRRNSTIPHNHPIPDALE